MAHRKNEEPRIWFRADRVFRVDEGWFIHTREGIAVGPYSDKCAAGVDAEMLKSLLLGVDEEAEAKALIDEFMQSGGKCLREIDYDADSAKDAEAAREAVRKAQLF